MRLGLKCSEVQQQSHELQGQETHSYARVKSSEIKMGGLAEPESFRGFEYLRLRTGWTKDFFKHAEQSIVTGFEKFNLGTGWTKDSRSHTGEEHAPIDNRHDTHMMSQLYRRQDNPSLGTTEARAVACAPLSRNAAAELQYVISTTNRRLSGTTQQLLGGFRGFSRQAKRKCIPVADLDIVQPSVHPVDKIFHTCHVHDKVS